MEIPLTRWGPCHARKPHHHPASSFPPPEFLSQSNTAFSDDTIDGEERLKRRISFTKMAARHDASTMKIENVSNPVTLPQLC